MSIKSFKNPKVKSYKELMNEARLRAGKPELKKDELDKIRRRSSLIAAKS